MEKIRKYITEAGLHVYVDKYALLKANEINEYKNEDAKFNLYCILAGERTQFEKVVIPDNEVVEIYFSYGTKVYCSVFQQKLFSPKPFSNEKIKITNNGQKVELVLDESDLLYVQNTRHDLLRCRAKNGKYVIRFGALFFLTEFFKAKNLKLDFDLLYIGQSYGKNNNRDALDRLESHSTFQKILADCMAEYPQKMIYVNLLSISDPLVLLGMDGFSNETQCSEEEDKKHLMDIMNDINYDFKFQQIINITEALLIHFFQPKYNVLLKTEFPNENSKGYQKYFTLDYNQVTFEYFPASGLPYMNLKTKSRSFECGFITYSLHKDKNRKSIFDIFDQKID